MRKKQQEKIYEEYYLKVRNFVLSKVNDYHLAEDLTSDIFVKIYSKYDSFDDTKSSLSTWIFTITRHHLIDYYRTRRVNEELPEDLTYEDEGESIATDENIELLKRGIKSLNDKERAVISFHYYSKLTLKEIAQKMNISYAYVKILHTKALLKMKEVFDSSSL